MSAVPPLATKYLSICFHPKEDKDVLIRKQKRITNLLECCFLEKHFRIENVGLIMYALNVNPVQSILKNECDFFYTHCLLHRISVLEEGTNNVYASYREVRKIYNWLKCNANTMDDLYTVLPIFSLEINQLFDKISIYCSNRETLPCLPVNLKYDDLMEIHKLHDELYTYSTLDWNIITSKGIIIPYKQYKKFKMNLGNIKRNRNEEEGGDGEQNSNDRSSSLDVYDKHYRENQEVIIENDLSIKYIPLVSVDIETVSTNMESIPSGSLNYEKIISITLIVELLRYTNEPLTDRILIFTYVYMDDLTCYVNENEKRSIQNNIASKLKQDGFDFKEENVCIKIFDNELDMLTSFTNDYIKNGIFHNIYNTGASENLLCNLFDTGKKQSYGYCDDDDDADDSQPDERCLHLLTGYNIKGYDINVIIRRMIYYKMFEDLENFICYDSYSDVYKLNRHSIQIDLLDVIIDLYSFGLPNFKLNTVSKKYLNISKVDVDVLDIRRIYIIWSYLNNKTKVNGDDEKKNLMREFLKEFLFTENRPTSEIKINNYRILENFFNNVDVKMLYFIENLRNVGNKRLPTIVKVIVYNVIDCYLLHMLWSKLNLDNTIKEFSDKFLTTVQAIFTRNNEKRHAKTIIVSYLTLGRFPSQIYDTRFYDNDDKDDDDDDDCECIDSVNILKENFLEKTKKNFYGAINAARPGFYYSGSSQDFSSFYVSCAIQYNISVENGCVIKHKTFKKFLKANREHLINEKGFLNDRILKLYVYEPPKHLANKQKLIEDPDLLNECLKRIHIRVNDPDYTTHPVPLTDVLPGERVTKEEYLKDYDDEFRLLVSFNLPSVITNFFKTVFEERKRYKELQKSAKSDLERTIYKQRELVYKLIGNSSYGRFGNLKGIYPCMYVCSFITLMARRNILLCTSYIKNKYPFLEVVYIDTDGYVLTNTTSEKLSDEFYVGIRDEINEYFSKTNNLPYIQIVNEGTFDYACIMTKKKYILYSTELGRVRKIKATGFIKSQNECVRNCFYLALFVALSVFTIKTDKLNTKDLLTITKYLIFSFWKYLKSISLEAATFSIPLNVSNNNSQKTLFIKHVIENLGGEIGTRYNVRSIIRYDLQSKPQNNKNIFLPQIQRKLISGYQEIPNGYHIDRHYLIKNFITMVAKIIFLAYASKEKINGADENMKKQYVQYFKKKIEESFFYFDCNLDHEDQHNIINEEIRNFLHKEYFSKEENDRLTDLSLPNIDEVIKILDEVS